MSAHPIDDGGPVHPNHEYVPGYNYVAPDGKSGGTVAPYVKTTGGLSLRDYFAASALQGMIATNREWDGSSEQRIAVTQQARFALAAYAFADAMLRARKERKDL